MNSYYSMMVHLVGRPCVVVGGGRVAERKVAALVQAEAQVTVISPTYTPLIDEWIENGQIKGIRQKYAAKDSEFAFLVIAATNSESVNTRVYQDATDRNQWVNVVDRTDLSNFISPASFTRGKLQISVSTSGTSPLLAKRIKDQLETIYGEEYEIYLDFLYEYRMKVKEHEKSTHLRQQMYKEMMAKDILQMIRKGEFENFKKEAFEKLGG